MQQAVRIWMRSLTLLLLSLAIALAACRAASAPPSAGELPTDLSATSAAPTSAGAVATALPPITVSDDLGRSVTLERVPQRIVSLAPSVTEILFAIGAGPQVVGRTTFCNYPAEVAALPTVGGFAATSISIEAIVGLQPDLVIAGSARQQPVVEQLERLGLPVVVLAPDSIEAVYDGIRLLGGLTGHADEADRVVATMQQRIAAVTAVVATIPAAERPRVYWEVSGDPLITAGPHTFIGQMIELVGATNIFADAQDEYPRINPEMVVERNPQVILGPDSQADQLNSAALRARPGWDVIEAVRTGRVYTLNADIVSRPGPRLAEAIEALAAQLYPEHFPARTGAAGAFPLTVSNCGLTQTYAQPPQRAVSMNQHTTEVLLALGLQARMVGTAYLDDAILPEYQAAYATIPVLADQYPSLEVLLAARPDFVYGGFRSAFEEGRSRAALQARGINSYLATEYCSDGPVTMEQVYHDIRTIGAIFGVPERAAALVADMQERIAAVQQRVPTGRSPRVFVYDSGEDAPFTAGGHGIANTIIGLAGGQNIFADLADEFGAVSWEAVIARDPEVILIFDYGETDAEQKRAWLQGNPALATISAIRNRRFAVLPLSSVVGGVRNPAAVEQVARALYPEVFQ